MPKRKPTKPQLTAVEYAAEETVSTFARQHAEYERTAFTERDKLNGLIEASRMQKIACVKALEGLARPHHRSSSGKAFLEPVLLMAANAYHADILESQGSMNHELREAIDKPTKTDASVTYRMEAIAKLSRINNRMRPDQRKAIITIFDRHDESLRRIWPDKGTRDKMKDIIKDGLSWLAVEYGLMK